MQLLEIEQVKILAKSKKRFYHPRDYEKAGTSKNEEFICYPHTFRWPIWTSR